MLNPVSQAINRQNLIDLSSLLQGCECFPFFGTLLGLTRAGDIIPHDDDIDIYANISDRGEILARLAASEFKIDLESAVNSSDWFLQATRTVGESESYVDFYFYEPRPDLGCVVERWNFSGQWKEDDNHLHLPNSLIYPIKSQEFFGVDIAMPADPVGCCEFLYGLNWRKPLMKRLGYTTKIVNHVPSIEVSPDQFTEIVRRFHELEGLHQKVLDQQRQFAEKCQELIAANRRLTDASEEIGRWRQRTADAENEIDEIKSTVWWKARSTALGGLDAVISLFKK